MATGAKVSPTRGESLFIQRRRKDQTQVEAAADYNVSADTYREWEADRGENVPRAVLGQLKPHEMCVLMRRRAKLTQKQLAGKVGCTRLWVIQMENGEASPDRLVAYWRL